MVEVIWIDGTQRSARTWAGLERALRDEQWQRFSKRGFRRELRRRSRVWAGGSVSVRVWGSARDLFEDLEAVGVLRVTEREEVAR